jgi:hypothetical protein
MGCFCVLGRSRRETNGSLFSRACEFSCALLARHSYLVIDIAHLFGDRYCSLVRGRHESVGTGYGNVAGIGAFSGLLGIMGRATRSIAC